MDFDFNWILVPATILFFLLWLLDKFVFKTKAKFQQKLNYLAQSEQLLEQARVEYNQIQQAGDVQAVQKAQDYLSQVQLKVAQAQAEVNEHKGNVLINWAYDFWPVLMVVLILRSFIYEPFNIPSESMNPTLETGDFILVNKYTYGIRLPLINTKIIEVGEPQHGDVVVFRYPNYEKDPQKKGQSYIKRIIGVPGDKITFQNGVIYINGVKQNSTFSQNVDVPAIIRDETGKVIKISTLGQQWVSQLGEHTFTSQYINLEQKHPSAMNFVQNTQLNSDLGLSLTENWNIEVPVGKYFVMGDNRDQSSDSRYWGFVPEENLAGQAVYVWMHKEPGLHIPSFKRNGSIP